MFSVSVADAAGTLIERGRGEEHSAASLQKGARRNRRRSVEQRSERTIKKVQGAVASPTTSVGK